MTLRLTCDSCGKEIVNFNSGVLHSRTHACMACAERELGISVHGSERAEDESSGEREQEQE